MWAALAAAIMILWTVGLIVIGLLDIRPTCLGLMDDLCGTANRLAALRAFIMAGALLVATPIAYLAIRGRRTTPSE